MDKKKKIITISLLGVLLLMVVGYAAFSSLLNINGTSSISSNWEVKITNIVSKNVVGSASNASDPTYDDLSATFKTNLVSPGDSIEYDVTVSNSGNVNAKLDKITLTDSKNDAIKFSTSGLTEGDVLNAGDSAVLTVKVEYDENVTSQPSNLSSTLTVKLDYSQNTGNSGSGTAGGNSFNDLKLEVDGKVPTNDLLFWGQADNDDNSMSILADKSGNGNDGILYNFDSNSGYIDDALEFDGTDDYVNLGFDGYDFKNSISYVIYFKINEFKLSQCFIGNWESAGGGILVSDGRVIFELYDGAYYIQAYGNSLDLNQYYTVIGVYDGVNLKIYIDGILINTKLLERMTTCNLPIIIGANSELNDLHLHYAFMSLKEVMLYDRALTDDEVKSITLGFEKKYK